MINKKYFILLLICILIIVGCTNNQNNTFKTITSEEAKIELDKDSSIILLDVRTKEEFDEKHIKGSVLIPLDELENKIIDEVPDKNTKIFVYCQGGNRSKMASNILVNLGYENIYDMGGINNWEYETE